MTQEAFKAWWYNEGSQAPYTHHDCEEHTMRMCEIAWVNGAYKALADHAMQEVQRLGQEIEQDADHFCDANCVWTDHHPDCKLAQPEQEPVAWMDADGNVSDNNDHKCFPIPLYTQPPQRTWVGLNDDEIDYLIHLAYTGDEEFVQTIEAKLKEKNT